MPTWVELPHGDNCRAIGPELAPWEHQFVALLQRASEVPDMPALGSSASPAFTLAFAAPLSPRADARGEWWRVFLDAPSSRAGRNARQKLLESYWPLVKSIVSDLCRRMSTDARSSLGMGMENLGGQPSREDLWQEGMLGLIAALDRFDPARGVNFAHFARLKIRGAVLDAVRRWWRLETAAPAPTPRRMGSDRRPSALPLGPACGPQPYFAAIEFDDLIAALTLGLDSRQQAVTRLWLQQQMSMAQIAAVLRLHISRIGQIRRGLLARWQADTRLRALLR